ncbi:histidine kinase [Campylobacter jejuni]|nr:histidine kinase [Campylobacter jejuni]
MSNKANSANEKSFLLLEQMLKSLFNVANKVSIVSQVSQNENELAKKVENMVNQAGNIQKATQMMDKIADKIKLPSLNAGIEVARAGAFGLGFSVIAEDDRQLAQNSEEFLGNVAQITKELLQSINEVNAELKKNTQSIQALNDDTALLVDDANEVKLCNEDARALVTQCTEKIKISQENI